MTGGTGTIGRHLVEELRARGTGIRLLVRDPARAPAGVETAVGDLGDRAALDRALVGAERMLLLGPGPEPDGDTGPMVTQECTAIDAAAAAGVELLVKVSALGADPRKPLSLGAHGRIEEHLQRARVPWALLRPGAFLQNFTTGAGGVSAAEGITGAYGDGRVAYIDARDIALSAAELLTGPVRAGASFTLTGPEALTQDEVAARLGAALGVEVPSIHISPDEVAELARAQGAGEHFAAGLRELVADLAAGAAAEVTGDVRAVLGRPAAPLEEFARRERAAFAV